MESNRRVAGLGAALSLVAVLGCEHSGRDQLPKSVPCRQHPGRQVGTDADHLRRRQRVKTCAVALSRSPVGDKLQQGDEKTPEGRFTIDGRLRESRYHRALYISYPDSVHGARAAAAWVPPGGQIMVHGIRNGVGWIGPLHRLFDWTTGCIAVTNPEIDELWRAVPGWDTDRDRALAVTGPTAAVG